MMIALLVLIAVLAMVYLICCLFGIPKSEEEQMLEDEEQIAYLAGREAEKEKKRCKKQSLGKIQNQET